MKNKYIIFYYNNYNNLSYNNLTKYGVKIMINFKQKLGLIS